MEFHRRVFVDKIVKSAGSKRETRNDTALVNTFALAVDDPGLDEIEGFRRNHRGMDAEIPAVAQMLQRLVGDAANIDMKGGAILDQLSNIAGNQPWLRPPRVGANTPPVANQTECSR